MHLSCLKITLGRLMIAIFAVALLLAWIVWWDARRVELRLAEANAIQSMAEHDVWERFNSPQQAIAESRRIREKARPFAEGGPDFLVLGYGIMIVLGVTSLALSIGKVLTLRLRRAGTLP